MQKIVITKATEAEINTLAEIEWRTFFETYANYNYEADMLAYFNANLNLDATVKQLQNPNSDFFIAWDKDQPIGYLKVNTSEAQGDIKETALLEIERIYVLAAYHGKKIGQLLYQIAVENAIVKNKTSIWLRVWEPNFKAIRFFEKNGFVKFDQHFFIVRNEQHIIQLMRKTL